MKCLYSAPSDAVESHAPHVVMGQGRRQTATPLNDTCLIFLRGPMTDDEALTVSSMARSAGSLVTGKRTPQGVGGRMSCGMLHGLVGGGCHCPLLLCALALLCTATGH
eukprot:654063-Amphidinium_carterae.1